MKLISNFNISLQTITQIKQNFINKSLTIKKILKDTFSHNTIKNESNVRHLGDKYEHSPESILKDGDTTGIIVKTVKFYPEDLEKMKGMSLNERINYKSILKEQGKYIH